MASCSTTADEVVPLGPDITPGARPPVILPQGSSPPDEAISGLAASPRSDGPVVAGTADLSQPISKHLGFHAYSTASIAQMALWWSFSPYFDVGIYLNGARAHTGHDNHLDNSAWLNAVSGQGWGAMPIWTGPQDPCANGLLKVSSFKTAQALYQGRLNAILASESATRAGIPAGSIIYYDLEPYHAACVIRKRKVDGSLVAKALLNGWIDELQSLKRFKAGVYIGGSNLSDFNQLQSAPYAVWVTRFDAPPGTLAKPLGKVTIWDFEDEGLLNSQFVNDNRIHHYRSNTLEKWGNVTINSPSGIDNDIEDAPVVGGNALLKLFSSSYTKKVLQSDGQAITMPMGINNPNIANGDTYGTIVGYTVQPGSPNQADSGLGFIDTSGSNGGMATFSCAGATYTLPYNINNLGVVVGYSEILGDQTVNNSFTSSSLVTNPTCTPVAISDLSLAINDAGWTAGTSGSVLGDAYLQSDNYYTFSIGGMYSLAYGLNGLGQLIGKWDSGTEGTGFIDDAGSADPSNGATLTGGSGIPNPYNYVDWDLSNINNNQDIVGLAFDDNSNNQFGFVLSQLGSGDSGMLIGDGNDVANGINDYRQIVGATYYPPSNGYYGWVMIPDTGN